jgi:hypothetical protein
MKLLNYLCIACCLITVSDLYSQTQIDSTKVKTAEPSSKKEEKNRNVMLNADAATGPRSVNIGLPFAGDIVIAENGVPVVYSFFPTSPLFAWNYDNSLGKMGLLSFDEGAILWGKVGYAVSSEDRYAGSKFKGFASLTTNSYGSQRYDVTLTGPMGKKGWGYLLSSYQGFERGPINFMYTSLANRTQLYKAAIQKKYAKGDIRLLFKYVDVVSAAGGGSYPLTYLGNGKTKPLPNFELGTDSYTIRDGIVPAYDPYTGQQVSINLADSKFNESQCYSLYLQGNHKFDNGWKLSYTSMYQSMNSPIAVTFPLSLNIAEANPAKYFLVGTNKVPWDGQVQSVINQIYPQSENKSSFTRVEATKKFGIHDLRVGLTEMYYHKKNMYYGGMFLQTVEPNPRLVDWYPAPGFKLTNGGLMPAFAGGYGNITDEAFNRQALYVSDDFKPLKWLDLSVAARIEHQDKQVLNNPYYMSNEFIGDKPLLSVDFNNKWNKVVTASAVGKLTNNFGLMADASSNSWWDSYFDFSARDANGNPTAAPGDPYPRLNVGKDVKITVTNINGGVYWNVGKELSIVSKLTRINKSNLKGGGAITNPSNPSERRSFDPIFYDISTLGWSTDIVATPFKNFNIHYLLTLQKPEYRNYSYSAFDVTYDYSNKSIPDLSKVLMEIDPSYMMMKGQLRAWLSLRYYGKAFENPTNAFFWNARWENFGGLDYNINKNIGLKLKVINFLDQKGVKGAIVGADQITSDANYIGKTVVASSILPRTIEFSVNVKF